MNRCLLLLCLLHISTAWGNPLDAFGLGARAAALGGAVTANAKDTSANYYNPAALAHLEAIRIDLGYTLVEPSLSLNEYDQSVDASRGLQAGIALPTRFGGHKAGFSVAVHLPDERISRIRALPQRQPRWVLWDNRPQRLVITSSAAFEVIDNLTIGAGLTYLANTAGRLDMGGRVDLFNAEDTFLKSGVDVTLSAVRYASVGLNWRPQGPWSFGVAWRQDFSLKLDLTVDVQADIVTGGETVVVDDGQLLLRSTNDNLYSPQQLYVGAAYAWQDWSISLELGWLDWSNFPTPTATVQLELNLDPLELELPLPDRPVAPNFTDILVPRIGVEWSPWRSEAVALTIRTGYFFEPSPAPSQAGPTNYVDCDKQGISWGMGLSLRDPSGTLPRPLEIDLALQSVLLTPRTYQKTDPADPVGDYTASGYTLGGHLTLGMEF